MLQTQKPQVNAVMAFTRPVPLREMYAPRANLLTTTVDPLCVHPPPTLKLLGSAMQGSIRTVQLKQMCALLALLLHTTLDPLYAPAQVTQKRQVHVTVGIIKTAHLQPMYAKRAQLSVMEVVALHALMQPILSPVRVSTASMVTIFKTA